MELDLFYGPLFFLYEYREKITNLIKETLTSNWCSNNFRRLWSNSKEPLEMYKCPYDCTKNLEIENSIGITLESDHRPLHLLCKSHTAETRDSTNQQILSEVEKTVKQKETSEAINPSLKLFWKGKGLLRNLGLMLY